METIKHILFIILVLVVVLFSGWLGWIGYNYFAPWLDCHNSTLANFFC